jgi:GTP cyclohydrolase I
MKELRLDWSDIDARLDRLISGLPREPKMYGIPRGGAIVAGLIRQRCGAMFSIVSNVEASDVIIDDILDSGATSLKFSGYDRSIFVLVDKQEENLIGTWVKFPWEDRLETDLEDHIRRIIEAIGDDPKREGLLETPKRLINAWKEIYSGYTDSDQKLKWFTSKCDEMVIVRNIRFWSTCEHHMLPFWGKADIAYIPKGKVIGISKIPRLVNAKARRLQIQENLTDEIGRALDHEGVLGVAVSLRGQHMCMQVRGVKQEGSVMVTNYLSGLFRTDPAARAEFMQGVDNGRD